MVHLCLWVGIHNVELFLAIVDKVAVVRWPKHQLSSGGWCSSANEVDAIVTCCSWSLELCIHVHQIE